VVLTIEMSSMISRDLKLCLDVRCVSRGHDRLIGGAGCNWRGDEGFQNEIGRLGLGACQFELFKHFGFRTKGSLCGGRSLQPSERPGLDRLDLWEIPM
jgi:hypothetical protein